MSDLTDALARDAGCGVVVNGIGYVRKDLLEASEARVDKLERALGIIAESYPWQPYSEGETIGDAGDLDIGVTIEGYLEPTNRRIARAALKEES